MADFTLKDERRPPPPAAPGLRQTPLGQMPLPPGTVLMESEKRELREFGWKEGDPVPPGFAQALAREKQAALDDAHSGTFRGPQPPPLKMPQEVPIDKLPAEHRASLEKMIADYRNVAPQIAEIAKDRERLAAMDPSIQEAIRVAQGQRVEVTGLSGAPTAAAPPPAADKPAERPDPDSPRPPTRCPHCQWELSQPDPTKPTKEDEAGFVVAVLGGQRFVKEYAFMGGRVRAAFRSLTSPQEGMVAAQLSRDQRDGRVNNIDDLFRLTLSYRLALSLDVLVFGGQELAIGKAVDDFLVGQPMGAMEEYDDRLLELVKKLQSRVPLSSAPVWNMLADACRQFMTLERSLQDGAYRPDFSSATEG